MKMEAFVAFIICLQVICTVLCDDGVLLFKNKPEAHWEDKPHFCINFNPYFNNLTATRVDAITYNLTDLSGKYGCTSTDYADKAIFGTAVLVARGNCSFTRKARTAQLFGARALIISSDELLMPVAENASVDYHDISITVATIMKSSVDKMNLHNDTKEVLMYAPQVTRNFDLSMIVIFLLSVTNIAIGGYWAGHTKHAKYQRLMQSTKSLNDVGSDEHHENDNRAQTDDKEEQKDTVDITVPALLVFFVLVCGFLVLLYFFYDQLVYVVIGLFCLAGATSLYACLYPIWKRLICCSAQVPRNRLPFLRNRPEYRNIILALLCMAFTIFWGIQRHAPYAWVIQDIIGYVFCLHMMKTVGVPNLKVCTVLLILLFIYDIFFVFITPMITSTGDSVMVKVATGSGSKTHETLPMLFKVPKLTRDIINVCPLPFSLLGYGDIIIPGFLVAHNHAFDLYVGSKKAYYVGSVVAYAVGLIITFVALALMKTGQPALLYLVPCTLITTFFIGWVRGEVKHLWAGMHQSKQEESESEGKQENHSTETVNSNSIGSNAENENRTLIRQ